MFILSILFFITAILYSSVGFGGGSTYLALLLIWDVPYYIFPVIALICNIFVVSGNCFNYIRAGNFDFKLLYPYLIGSIPAAYIGGSLSVDKDIFEIILFFVLISAGITLLINFKSYEDDNKIYKRKNHTFHITKKCDNLNDKLYTASVTLDIPKDYKDTYVAHSSLLKMQDLINLCTEESIDLMYEFLQKNN